jgi:hypothetical protein
MTIGTRWRKSEASGQQDNCVEMPETRNALRDSKNRKVVMPVAGVPTFVAFLRADRTFTPVAS